MPGRAANQFQPARSPALVPPAFRTCPPVPAEPSRSARSCSAAVPEFNSNGYKTEPFYVQDGAWSPNGSVVYFGTTGYHPDGLPTGTYPRTGPCDAALAFSSAPTAVSALWTNYTGCDSLYAAAADAHAAYFAGHERWSMNPQGCDSQGPGANPAPGMEGLDPRQWRPACRLQRQRRLLQQGSRPGGR